MRFSSRYAIINSRRLWFSWDDAQVFALARTISHTPMRRQQVRGVVVDGQWLWHVRAKPLTPRQRLIQEQIDQRRRSQKQINQLRRRQIARRGVA